MDLYIVVTPSRRTTRYSISASASATRRSPGSAASRPGDLRTTSRTSPTRSSATGSSHAGLIEALFKAILGRYINRVPHLPQELVS